MARDESEKTEKITINLGLVDLGQIDLLVQEGFYANRTDFIRTAIRTQLATRGDALDQTAARRTLTLGSCHYTRRDLEEIRDEIGRASCRERVQTERDAGAETQQGRA